MQGINLLTSALAAIGGLPPDDLGLNQVNPASAEARRAAETTLVNRVKEKWRPYGGAYTRAMRLAVAFRDGVPLDAVPPEFDRMQTAWQDPATPAIAQAMDAAVRRASRPASTTRRRRRSRSACRRVERDAIARPCCRARPPLAADGQPSSPLAPRVVAIGASP